MLRAVDLQRNPPVRRALAGVAGGSFLRPTRLGLLALVAFPALAAPVGELSTRADFHKTVEPLLAQYCSDCHEDGARKGNVDFDDVTAQGGAAADHELWLKVLRNVRAGIMPPVAKARPTPEELERLAAWIKYDAFGIDPNHPDPGRVTVRRLNRVEYRNTIHDLMGVDFDTEREFPPDDTGFGFDDIADVLTLSPMLLEKYLAAASAIVAQSVPVVPRVATVKTIPGRAFHQGDAGSAGTNQTGALSLSYYDEASVSNTFMAAHAGHYQLVLDLTASEKFVDDEFDYNRCRLLFKADGKELLRQDFIREGGRPFHYEFDQDWPAGARKLEFELEPLTPNEKQVRSLALRLDSVTVRGPLEEKFWLPPANYARFFPREAPTGRGPRRAYARELLAAFATRAFRRPVDDETANRLTDLAEGIYRQPGKTFEAGIAHALVGVLASPRFLFREEQVEPGRPTGAGSFIDEYSLASRLSYFLWSTMPDDELFRLAGAGKLRKNFAAQVARMLADPRSEALTKNFTGQWLETRDIESVPIDARAVLAREKKADPETDKARARFRQLANKSAEELTPDEKEELKKARASFSRSFRRPRVDLTGEVRKAMRREAETYFGNLVQEDRSVLELIDSDYTFLNEKLAAYYGLTNLNVTGAEFRRVKLPPDSPLGGVLTMGSVLAVTSNPTRTSPVKRGLFILENVLGNPTPPPPPNIPALEDTEQGLKDREPTLREVLALHREKPLCSSCHNRMDPLGLALENFNALGLWRDRERGQPIDASGKLITGESFPDIRALKHILVTQHRLDFYHTLTEKLLTYALGRGLEYYDVESVDRIVARLDQESGRFSALLMGVVESAPFQKRRTLVITAALESAKPAQQRAEIKPQP